jgi:AGCS family alanine or glycine:cation symporter
MPEWLSGIGLALLTTAVIFGGARGVARFSERVVPLMALAYILMAFYVAAINIEDVPAVLALIVKSAFGLEQAGAGAFGFSVSQAVLNGIKRGLFPNAAASATPFPHHPASQGYVQMLGVFFDTMVICSCSAAIILLSGEFQPGSGITGIELIQRAVSSQVGPWGLTFVAVSIFFFAFTSIIASYAYAESNMVFLGHSSTFRLGLLRFALLFTVFFGSTGSLPLVWALADVAMGVMTLVNLSALFILAPVVSLLFRDYHQQLKAGLSPRFDTTKHSRTRGKITPGIWN